jgi:hypothetical protein
MGYGLEGRVSIFYTSVSRPAPGSTQPHIQRVPWALSTEVKRQGREADHFSPSGAECSYTSTPSYVFIAWWLIN